MRKLLLRNGHFQLEHMQEPQITGDHEVKVRIAYTAICGFDVDAFTGKITLRSKRGEIGHEVSGYVVQTGKAVTRLKPGMKVTIHPLQPCMTCAHCMQGRYAYCEEGVERYSTLMQEYVVARESQVFEVAADLPVAAATLTETVASAIHIAQRGCFDRGGSAIILGHGGLGATLLALGKHYPLAKLAVVEPMEDKRQLARELGADKVWDPVSEDVLEQVMRFTNNECFDTVVETSGSKEAALLAPQVVARGGNLVYAGLYDALFCTELNLFELYWKDLSVHGVFVAPWDAFYKAVQMLPALPWQRLISDIMPVEEAERAFEQKSAGRHIKLLLDWHAPSAGE